MGESKRPPVTEADKARYQRVLIDIGKERDRQDEKFGEQNHPDLKWLAVCVEELGEAAQAACKLYVDPVEKDGVDWEKNLETEVLEFVASGVAWLESRRRQAGRL